MGKKPEVTGEIRDEQGKFKPGVSGNPDGRPPGSGISITTEIKRKLVEIPEGKDKTYLQYLIEQILKKAVIEGDQQTIKQIWNYIDGMPKQDFGVSGGLKISFDKTFYDTAPETKRSDIEQGEVQSN